MTKRALISGIGGQDSSYLAELLLDKGYTVYGFARRTAHYNLQNVQHLLSNERFHILYGDVTDMSSIINAIETAEPDEFYNLAAMSFVGQSWNQPIQTTNSVAVGNLNCLEALRITRKTDCRFYFAGSSEQFGKVRAIPQTEETSFYPRSPYGVAKVYGFEITRNFRESYNMFASSGILYNHESERRAPEFVTRKITLGVARIALGINDKIVLGNLDAKRDWTHAEDMVRGMWLILQHQEPDDFILASGTVHSVKDFLSHAFKVVGIDDWAPYVEQDQKHMRPAEVDFLLGDASKAQKLLNWKPEISFETMVQRMVESDIAALKAGRADNVTRL
jgi:GDPmannose 4,6-dehydratase